MSDGHTLPLHSTDGRWWWNGAGWVPAFTNDHSWWWDGQRWIRVKQPRILARAFRLPRWLWAVVGSWAGLLFVPWLFLPSSSTRHEQASVTVWLVLLVAVAAVSIAVGVCLAFELRPWPRFFVVAAVGTLAISSGVFAWSANDPANNADPAFGLFAVVVAVPTLVALGALLATGVAIGSLLRLGLRHHVEGTSRVSSRSGS
jgi:hypothetical protein